MKKVVSVSYSECSLMEALKDFYKDHKDTSNEVRFSYKNFPKEHFSKEKGKKDRVIKASPIKKEEPIEKNYFKNILDNITEINEAEETSVLPNEKGTLSIINKIVETT